MKDKILNDLNGCLKCKYFIRKSIDCTYPGPGACVDMDVPPPPPPRHPGGKK